MTFQKKSDIIIIENQSRKEECEMKKYVDIIKSMRNDWGNVKPYTRIHVSKKYKKPKYKKLEME